MYCVKNVIQFTLSMCPLKEGVASLLCAAIVYSFNVYSRIFHIMVLCSGVNQLS